MWKLIFFFNEMQISTLVLILIADIGGFGLTMIITFFVVKGTFRVHAVGLICAIFNIAVFAAPLSIMVCTCSNFYHSSYILVLDYDPLK
jgi:solute carrier family 50 protein (sugar transporter)